MIAILAALPAAAQDSSLRFFGNGVAAPQQDRVKIRLDGPARPADVGATDFTMEFWLKADTGNASGSCVSGGDGWINGNVIVDRDVFGAGDLGDFGLSLFGAGGRLAFGAAVGSSGETICGATNVIDGTWHHVAATRRASHGLLRLFVDGQLDASADGPDGVAFANGEAPDGLAKLTITGGAAGRATAIAKGKRTALGLPAALPFGPDPVVVVQLLDRDGTCWTVTFPTASRSSAEQLKAKHP